ncbi:MAG: carbohydrate ABC transporter permease [Candidatus Bipolaricaulota bacterium]|nr:MAG: carbohydrate ABC transporter permease [Candidatus Bipolaricaulota bacterium]
MLLPFVWMLTTSLKTSAGVLSMPPQWIPTEWKWSNYIVAWHTSPFGRYFFNSFFMSGMTTIGEVILTILAAYAFAKMKFLGRNALFTLLLGTLMIPGQMLLVPNFVTISRLGWIDTYQALIIPWLASVFAIFLLRQFFRSLPDELWDSARMDGCGRFRFLWRIMVPLAKPAIVTVAILKFIGGWNAYLWVLVMTNSELMRTVPVGLVSFSSEVGTQYELLMAASVLAILPILILYFFTQKQFIKSFARTGIK